MAGHTRGLLGGLPQKGGGSAGSAADLPPPEEAPSFF